MKKFLMMIALCFGMVLTLPAAPAASTAAQEFDCAAAQQRILQLYGFIDAKILLIARTQQELTAYQNEAMTLAAQIVYFNMMGMPVPAEYTQRLNWLLATGIPGKQNTLAVAEGQLFDLIAELQELQADMLENGC
jgi:hypothetical protein